MKVCMIRYGILMWLAMEFVSFNVFADTNSAPNVFSVDFTQSTTLQDSVDQSNSVNWLRHLTQADGYFDQETGAWIVPTGADEGQGRLVAQLNREHLPADLALTLVYEETPDADLVVQLWDDKDQIVALDLFSNIITAGKEAQTDTFILSLADHPSATQIVIRRLKGEVRIYGLVLTPVACEVPVTTCDDGELAIQLRNGMNAENPLVQEVNRIAKKQEQDFEWDQGQLQQRALLAESNEAGHKTLTDTNYPAYRPAADHLSGQLVFPASGSVGFIDQIARQLNLYHRDALIDAPGSLSSTAAKEYVLEGIAPACAISMPMSEEDKDLFYRKFGYALIETPIALDALCVFVNEDNPLDSITLPQLDAIYGGKLLAGHTKGIQTWDQLGLGGTYAGAKIEAWGHSLKTGTARTFQRIVLKGGPYHENVQDDNVHYFLGTLRTVAQRPYAIGFVDLMKYRGTKILGIAKSSEHPFYLPEPETIYAGQYPLRRFFHLYVNAESLDQMDPILREFLNLLFSREGQTTLAELGGLPLGAKQVIKSRELFGL